MEKEPIFVVIVAEENEDGVITLELSAQGLTDAGVIAVLEDTLNHLTEQVDED